MFKKIGTVEKINKVVFKIIKCHKCNEIFRTFIEKSDVFVVCPKCGWKVNARRRKKCLGK